jgi:hypothetical protein
MFFLLLYLYEIIGFSSSYCNETVYDMELIECMEPTYQEEEYAQNSLVDCWLDSGKGKNKNEAVCGNDQIIYLYDHAEHVAGMAMIFYFFGD